ncbi:MAG: hypothetical protein JXR83_14000 [Deltaproteobacteria bacterium]|nr:hypothetical protein [Deltaproteobacteria bacterium]
MEKTDASRADQGGQDQEPRDRRIADAATTDQQASDGNREDAARLDRAPTPDTAAIDAGPPDAASIDAVSTEDASTDAGPPDALGQDLEMRPCITAAECAPGYCYADEDGDRYAPADGVMRCHSAPLLEGVDCCDLDDRAHPGTGSYYSETNMCGSWDYDCDGATTKRSYTCEDQLSLVGGDACTLSTIPDRGCRIGYQTLQGTTEFKECGETFVQHEATYSLSNYCNETSMCTSVTSGWCNDYGGPGCRVVPESGGRWVNGTYNIGSLYCDYLLCSGVYRHKGYTYGAIDIAVVEAGSKTCTCR